MGDDVANSLMEHLPPSGWSDVARTHDIERLDDRIVGLRNTVRVVIGTMITISLGLFGLLFQISQAVSGG